MAVNADVPQVCNPKAFLNIGNLFFLPLAPTGTAAPAKLAPSPCTVDLLVPISGLPAVAFIALGGPSEVRGRLSTVPVVPPGLCASGQEMSLALLSLLGVFLRWSLGLLGELCAVLVCDATVGGCKEIGSAFGELGPNTRPPLEGIVVCVSALERSEAVFSVSVLRMFDESRFLLPSDPKKDRFLFSFSAAFLA